MNTSHYIPGVCNIGEAEIKQRKQIGWIGLLIVIVLWIVLDVYHVAYFWKIFIFFPASLSATGFLQGFMHFCAGFGLKGVFNFGPEVGKTDTASQAEFRAMDRRKAINIFMYSVLIGLVITVVACLW
jgi:predicted nucleic acid-binding Zn ribbon protein